MIVFIGQATSSVLVLRLSGISFSLVAKQMQAYSQAQEKDMLVLIL